MPRELKKILFIVIFLFLGHIGSSQVLAAKKCTEDKECNVPCEKCTIGECTVIPNMTPTKSSGVCCKAEHCSSGEKCINNKCVAPALPKKETPASAPAPNIPSIDQRCWQKGACEADGSFFYGPNAETSRACRMEQDASGKPIGFCTATTQPVTQVGFGGAGEGKKSFENFGKFIQWIYRYGIMIAGLLAMFMIIVAGFQWVTSAGSQERIASAKKRIGGALIGLLIALLSYTILSTINPYLVNLRLPQVWKINTIGIVPPYCNEVGGKKLTTTVGGKYDIEPAEAECGKKYYVEGGGSATCDGSWCKSGSHCSSFEMVEPVANLYKKINKFHCYETNNLIILLELDSFLQDLVGSSWLAGAVVGVITDKVETPYWLDYGAGDGSKVYVRCSDGRVSGKNYDLAPKGIGKDGYTINPINRVGDKSITNYNFVLKYFFTEETFKDLNKKCPTGTTATAFYIRHEIKKTPSSEDPNIYISPISRDSKILKIGPWEDIFNLPGFSIESLLGDGNRIFKGTINQTVVRRAFADWDSEPGT